MLTVCLRCDQYLLLKATVYLTTPRLHQLVVRIAGRESEDGEASSVPPGQLHVVALGGAIQATRARRMVCAVAESARRSPMADAVRPVEYLLRDRFRHARRGAADPLGAYGQRRNLLAYLGFPVGGGQPRSISSRKTPSRSGRRPRGPASRSAGEAGVSHPRRRPRGRRCRDDGEARRREHQRHGRSGHRRRLGALRDDPLGWPLPTTRGRPALSARSTLRTQGRVRVSPSRARAMNRPRSMYPPAASSEDSAVPRPERSAVEPSAPAALRPLSYFVREVMRRAPVRLGRAS